MTRKKFIEMIQGTSRKARGVMTSDATLVYGKPLTAICVFWEGTYHLTTIKTMKGESNETQIIDELNKYKEWFDKYLEQK